MDDPLSGGNMELSDMPDEQDDEQIADRLAGMGIEAGGWKHELHRLDEQDGQLEHLIPTAEHMMREVQEKAARRSGKGLYDVRLRFSRILAEDKDEAIDEAEAGFGHLIERRAWLVYEPPASDGTDGATGRDQGTSELMIPPQHDQASVDWVEFFLTFDELCLDPATGETVIPDLVMISEDLCESFVRDPTAGRIRPGDDPSIFKFPIQVVPHAVLKKISGNNAHLIAFDRRKTLAQTLSVWDGPDEGWEETVRRSVEP